MSLRLRETDHAACGLADKQAARVTQFFHTRQESARAFAANALSLRGKWELLKSKLPYTDAEGHEHFLRDCFERHLFKADDLKECLHAAVAGYVTELEGVENQLLVAIRADLSDRDFAPLQLPTHLPDDQFHRAYRRLIAEVEKVAHNDLKVTAAREVATLVAADVATAVSVRVMVAAAERLGISGAVLGAGAASGWVTLGVGVGVAVVIDRVIDWVLRQTGYDAESKVAEEVRQALTRVATLLQEGNPEGDGTGKTGLKAELTRWHQERARLREAALRRFVFGADIPR